MEPKEFKYLDSQGNQHEVKLTKEDFVLVQKDVVIRDQKMQSKPTTFFRDALRRFRKNKSSVAGAIILGTLIAFALVLPLALPSDIDNPHPDETLLAPKLFDAGFGWWDGGYEYKDVVMKVDWDKYDEDGTIVASPTEHDMSLVIGGQDGIKTQPVSYGDAVNTYAHGGYARLNGQYRATQLSELAIEAIDAEADITLFADNTYTFVYGEDSESGTWSYESSTLTLIDPAKNETTATGSTLAFTYALSTDDTVVANFSTSATNVQALLPLASPTLNSWNGATFDFSDDSRNYTISIETVNAAADPELSPYWNYGSEVSYNVDFVWNDLLQDKTYSYSLASNVSTYGLTTFKLNEHLDKIRAVIDTDPFSMGNYELNSIHRPHLAVSLNLGGQDGDTNNVVIKQIVFTSDAEEDQEDFNGMSMYDANKSLSIQRVDAKGNVQKYYWLTANGSVNLFHTKLVKGTYRIDTYLEKLGLRTYQPSIQDLRSWAAQGWIEADFTIPAKIADLPIEELDQAASDFAASIKVLDEKHSPILLDADHPITGKAVYAGSTRAITISCTVTYWKVLYPGADSCPRYLFGTDKSGKDMLHQVFAGLRTSLVLGVLTTAVNLTIGLIYGAIAGYFGGWTDILMERFTDILGGVPWIVVMTLCIILMGNTFWVFALALCLTGWIGTSSTTRTQFYRFKNREYILAARTLGASDGRLIFRHILPNAVGTIVTSSVLMIPGVIFSEATISYLRLGMQGVASFGVILSENQDQIQAQPHLILFPSVIMALIMISFNLFGNGLRDAFNPSLKGGE